MKVGPSEPACRSRFQTTISYIGKEPMGLAFRKNQGEDNGYKCSLFGKILKMEHMAPIKRLVSIKNTYPSQKETIFLQKQYSDRSQSLFYCLRPVFQTVVVCTFSSICYQAPIGIKADEKKQIHRPWSISGPQKNIGTLSCPKGCNKISGSLRPTIAGA